MGLALFIVNRRVVAPTVDMTRIMNRLARGDDSIRAPAVDRSDEVGDMAKAVEVFKQHSIQIKEEMAARKRVEDALRESEANYRLLAKNATDMISRRTLEGTYLYVSPACRILLGYEPEDLIGRPASELIHPEDLEEVKRYWLSFLEGSSPYCSIYRIRRKDGSYTWFETMGKITEEASTASAVREVVSISRDISQRKLMEEELIRAKKLEATGILAGGIAHDFNNLLSVVLGNIEMAIQEPESAADLLKRAEDAVFQARDLARKFITFSSGGSPLKRLVSTERFIRDCARSSLTGSNLECRYRLEESLWSMEADEDQIAQVLHTLITNAEDAMPRGGIIEIAARNAEAPGKESCQSVQEGKYVMISVKDWGTGIAREDLERIFDPYFSTKQRGSQRGMGLGLPIVHSVVKKHGGCICVESSPGEGSTFTICLPARELKARDTENPV